MGSIRIEIGGRASTHDQSRALRVGREPACDVLVDAPTVSRSHAELRPAGDGWEVVDLGSTHGTWVNGQQVARQMLGPGTTIVRFGLTEGGASIQVTVDGAAPTDRPAAGATANIPPPALAATVLPSTPGAPGMPGGGPGLLVRTRGGDLRFGTQAPVRIGREPGLEVVVDDAGVSRQHALVEPRPDGWWYVDRSNSGSFVDGERVVQRRLEEPTTVVLGHPTAGYELELVPVVAAGQASATIARKKRRKALAVVAAAVAVLVVVGGGVTAAVVLSDDDPSPSVDDRGELSEAELDRAKRASVRLTAVGADGIPTHTGSGSIISEDGLILTNAHVGHPSAPGQGGLPEDDPAFLLVALTSEKDDTPVADAYRAEPIVSDGYLDIAVLQITADAEGNEVDTSELDLPEELPIGDSDKLRTGDEITALGFPGVATANTMSEDPPALTVTRGVVSTFNSNDLIGPRAEIDSDLRLGSGNSGGASINNDGEIIGLNTRVFTEALGEQLEGEGGIFTGGSARIVPVKLAAEVLEIAEAGGDPSYVSPYVEELPPPPSEMPVGAEVVSAGWTGDGQGSCSGSSSIEAPQEYAVPDVGQVIFAEFSVVGIEDGTPVTFDFYDLAGETVLSSGQQEWDFGTEDVCIYVPFEVPEGATGANATFKVGDQVLAQNPVVFVEP